jgi:hypothetical protein
VAEVDPVKRQSISDHKVTKQNGDLVSVGRHIMRWTKDKG